MYLYLIRKETKSMKFKTEKIFMDYANTMAAMSALTRSLVLFVSSPDRFTGPVCENSRGPAESHYANLPPRP